jgi:diaminopimelate decarboxylase
LQIEKQRNVNVQTSIAYRDGQLYMDGVSLNEVATQVGTPCYVYSRDGALANFRRLEEVFPSAEIHYSLKANANLALIGALARAGAGMDAVSGGEIFRAIRAGVEPARIVFAGVGKTVSELTYALDTGIGWFNVESVSELARLAQIARSKGKRPRVALRVNPDVQADTHHYIATGHAGAKFGISLGEAQQLLNKYISSPDIDLSGLHLHIGSQLGTVQRTVEAVQAVLPLVDAYPEQLQTLNLGGGFPVSYAGEPVPLADSFASALHTCLEGRSLRLLLEPGRYIVADAGVLLVSIEYVKSAPDGVILVADGGMTELIRPALYGATHNVLPVRDAGTAMRATAHIVGPICESADILRAGIALPPLQAGDLLAVLHAGAYGAVMGSTYNARPRPPEILVEGASWRIVRRRETWDDLIGLEMP